MYFIRQPNRWSCGPTALAMLLGVSYDEIIRALGHDGSEILFPQFGEPRKRKAFVMAELIEAAWNLGTALIGFETNPFNEDLPVYVDPDARFHRLIAGQPGLFLGQYAADRPHMVAWDGLRIFNPDGGIEELDDCGMMITHFFAAVRIKS